MIEPLIRLEDIYFAFTPDRPVLQGVNMHLSPGERLGLAGAIGCGKTTLLHLIVGLVKPDRGVVRAFGAGRNLERDFHEVRRRAGMVFQRPDDQLFCPTVIEDVAFGPLNLGASGEEAREIAAKTLAQLSLSDFSERITYRLSGGEKRLVSLAAVLAMKPEVLLLDEPTAGLDEKAKSQLVEVLDELDQAMIIVSHESGFISSLATRWGVMKDGIISE